MGGQSVARRTQIGLLFSPHERRANELTNLDPS